jgi:hypothetical protein
MGRGHSGTPTCEAHHWIDVRRWQREGRLKPGLSFPYSWTCEGEPCGSIEVRIESTAVLLSFRVRIGYDDEWRSVEQRVPVTWTPCRFGGGRPWFLCTATSNGTYCGRRAAILYLGSSAVFACRQCYRLVYASQLEALPYRGLGRARKIRMRLGGGADLFGPFPPRPRGMHQRTYVRLREIYNRAVDG